jgi:hypothetical protein
VPALLGHRHELVRRVERVLAMQGAARRNVSFGGAAMAACAIAMISMQLHGLRFAEVANILFPTDQVRPVQPAQWAWGGVEQVQRAQHVREVQPAAPVRPTRLTQQVEQLQSVGSVELVQDVSAPVAPALSARTFDAAYVRHESVAPIAAFTADARMSPDVPVAPDTPIARDRWSTFAAPGIEIASVTKKTSIGVANVFSRAGVSLARSF